MVCLCGAGGGGGGGVVGRQAEEDGIWGPGCMRVCWCGVFSGSDGEGPDCPCSRASLGNWSVWVHGVQEDPRSPFAVSWQKRWAASWKRLQYYKCCIISFTYTPKELLTAPAFVHANRRLKMCSTRFLFECSARALLQVMCVVPKSQIRILTQQDLVDSVAAVDVSLSDSLWLDEA